MWREQQQRLGERVGAVQHGDEVALLRSPRRHDDLSVRARIAGRFESCVHRRGRFGAAAGRERRVDLDQFPVDIAECGALGITGRRCGGQANRQRQGE